MCVHTYSEGTGGGEVRAEYVLLCFGLPVYFLTVSLDEQKILIWMR